MSDEIKMWISFVLGLLLTILPLPLLAQFARPDWILLFILFWSIYQLNQSHLWIAFVLGLIVDSLTGTIFGQHAFIYALVMGIGVRWQRQFYTFPVMQMAGVVALISILTVFLQFEILKWSFGIAFSAYFLLPIFTNVLVWPWLYYLLRGSRDYLHV